MLNRGLSLAILIAGLAIGLGLAIAARIDVQLIRASTIACLSSIAGGGNPVQPSDDLLGVDTGGVHYVVPRAASRMTLARS
jgi:hypothetical protein